MRRPLLIMVLLLVSAMLVMLVWVTNQLPKLSGPPSPQIQVESRISPSSSTANPLEALLVGYGDLETQPMEDLRKIQRVAIGYFSLIKDPRRFAIGGNEDFSAALQGENPNREVYVRRGNPVFSAQGLLLDRWATPVVVHPQGWRQLELRSAGPDRIPYNGDDLVLTPNGTAAEKR